MGTTVRCRWPAAVAAFVAMLAAAPLGARALFDFDGGPGEAPIPVYEYYDAARDHYFLTASPPEFDALESGRFAGWRRAGNGPAFLAFGEPVKAHDFPAALANAQPVCRYFIPPASHFLSASREECAAVGAAHPEFVFETDAAFYAWLPDRATGRCPQPYATVGGFEYQPVYRLWNGQADTNHRLTTSRTERAAMIAGGWVAEGYGDDGVAMCVPSWHS